MAQRSDTPTGALTLEAENQPKNALDAAIEAARLANPVIETPGGRVHAYVPHGFTLKDVSYPHQLTPWPVQKITVDNRRSLSDYANRFKTPEAVIIADYDAMAIAAHLDWHGHNEAEEGIFTGPNRHTATLKILQSEEFKRWDAVEGEFHKQEVFAAFLEENSVDIAFPEAAVMVEISRDLEATTDQKFAGSVRLENGDRKFRFETETRVTNDVVVPKEFTLNIPLYNGELPTELRAAFRYRPTAQGLLLAFEWRRVEYQRRATFAEIAAIVSEETGLPVFMGRIAA